jgi:flavin reductase (DIM6/NTAB) family NADH-FMN oxidoreductase RutF
MKSFNPYDLHIRERHQYITGAIGPRPICWASTINEDGESNLAPYSFFNAFSSNPPILVFSSNRRGRDNTTKDTLHNIQQTMEVVINVVPHHLVNQMNISSTDYPSTTNEFEKAGVTPLDSLTVKPKRVKESPVQFECSVKEIISLGDVGGAGNLFICEITHMHIDENILGEDGMIDPQKIDLVGRMGKDFYVRAHGEAIFEIDNPFEKMNIGFNGLPEKVVQSKVLKGNEIAQLAMETSLPDANEIKAIKASLELTQGNIERQAQILINDGKVREALCLLLS